MTKSFNSRPKRLAMTSLINKNSLFTTIAMIMHDDHDIDQRFLKKKKKKKKKDLPTYLP